MAHSSLNVVEVPSFEYTRVHGASNLHAVRDGLRVLRTIFTTSRDILSTRHVEPDDVVIDIQEAS